MRALEFKAQPTSGFFSTVNQMFGSSSQLPTTVDRAVIKSLCTVQTTKLCSAVVRSWEEELKILLTVAKSTFVAWALNFGVHVLLKGAVTLSSNSSLLASCWPSVSQLLVDCWPTVGQQSNDRLSADRRRKGFFRSCSSQLHLKLVKQGTVHLIWASNGSRTKWLKWLSHWN